MERKKKKGSISTVIIGLVFLVGLGIMLYPTISNQWNTFRQSRLINHYESNVSEMTPEDFSAEWDAARKFNKKRTHNELGGDVFGKNRKEMKNTEYWKVLNLGKDGIMGYLSIPKINIQLSIYHGTADEVLQTGIGHISGTNLPIGGKGTHSVLAAHRGLPEAKLFTDVDQLEKGDKFYIHVMDQVLAYQVDRILPMIEKDDTVALDNALEIKKGKDYVTLFTCTPYGVNSHRLLVRGTRVAYNGEEESTPVETMLKAVRNYYLLFCILGLAITILIIGLLRRRMLGGKAKARKAEGKEEQKL